MLNIKIKRYDEQNKKKNKKLQEMQLRIDNQDYNTLLIKKIKADAGNNNQEVTNLIETRLKTEVELLQPVERICSLIIIDMCIKDKIY
jgi:hypothetical protein